LLGAAIAQQHWCPDPKVRLGQPQVSKFRRKGELMIDAENIFRAEIEGGKIFAWRSHLTYIEMY